MVFDDGWVELPGFGRALSDTRSNLRRALLVLAVLFGAPLVGGALEAVGVPEVALVPLYVLAVAALAYGVVLVVRAKLANFRQLDGDHAQARAEAAAEQRVRPAPGAPTRRRAESAAQFASWLEGAVHVDASHVSAVTCERVSGEHRAEVRLSDGTARTYRSPDSKLPRLLAPFGNA